MPRHCPPPVRPMLADKIKTLRETAPIRLTQEHLANYSGCSCSAVSRWESGEHVPSLDHLADIANFFGVDMDWLDDDELGMDRITYTGYVPAWARATDCSNRVRFSTERSRPHEAVPPSQPQPAVASSLSNSNRSDAKPIAVMEPTVESSTTDVTILLKAMESLIARSGPDKAFRDMNACVEFLLTLGSARTDQSSPEGFALNGNPA